jgi:para-aminobenzoate synthetase component 1
LPTDFTQALNVFGKEREPFFFAIDFEQTHCVAYPLKALPSHILYALNTNTNASSRFTCKPPSLRVKAWVDTQRYTEAFDALIEEIKSGNTYVLNLTFPTSVMLEGTLEDVFYASDAPYKCCFKEHFVCFSPERFVHIEGNTISTYPMKGTIDASIANAEALILNDAKEMAEHVMVVDLLRNDLSMVSHQVRVEQFRYVQSFKAGEKELLQVSSKITGTLDDAWHERVGDILMTLLPAGSISGTPKRSSVAIIKALEGYERGYFSGVFGVYDGQTLDSGVMIRFLEHTPEGLVFKSGGGVTLQSDCQKEYDELCAKVYIPVH